MVPVHGFGTPNQPNDFGLPRREVPAVQFRFEVEHVPAASTTGVAVPPPRVRANFKAVFLPVVDGTRAAPLSCPPLFQLRKARCIVRGDFTRSEGEVGIFHLIAPPSGGARPLSDAIRSKRPRLRAYSGPPRRSCGTSALAEEAATAGRLRRSCPRRAQRRARSEGFQVYC